MDEKACGGYRNVDAEAFVKTVEAWSAKHPIKTRQSVFLERYPNTILDEDSIIRICPAMISADYRDINRGCEQSGDFCPDCRREFWMQEIE